MTDETVILPLSAHAARIIVQNYTYGDLIPMDELDKMLEVEVPTDATHEEYKTICLRKLSLVSDLTNRLLEDHSILIKNIRTEGYQLVLPKEQTPFALDEMDKKLKKTLRKAGKRLRHVQRDQLTEKEQQQNIIGMQRAAGIKSMLRRERKLFASGLKQIDVDD